MVQPFFLPVIAQLLHTTFKLSYIWTYTSLVQQQSAGLYNEGNITPVHQLKVTQLVETYMRVLRGYKCKGHEPKRLGTSVLEGEESTVLQKHNPKRDTLTVMCPPCVIWTTHNAVMCVLHVIQKLFVQTCVSTGVWRLCVSDRFSVLWGSGVKFLCPRDTQKSPFGFIFLCWL